MLGLLWLAVTIRFWAWWLEPGHRGSVVLYAVATAALAYHTTLLPSFYWFFVGRARKPVEVEAPPGQRVALVTLCVPSHETLDVIEGQLRAMVAVEYPHDSWVLDEGGMPEIALMAVMLGVRYFTRIGEPRYNQPGPPFQARTKAGNVNAWLDSIADDRADYDFFVQLDIDHRPRPDYLHRTLGHFRDPSVGWVQAPSVCQNLDRWTARGLCEQDLILQGPLQMGFYGHSGTPFIIGSHTTYRTAAIRAIGGYQPTRAEDHLDTVVLASEGWKGVYVPEVIASGDGPDDFPTYLRQQFAWAYSMIQICFQHTPRLIRRYTPAQAFQFLMAQTWYPLWSLSVGVLWVLPIVALLTDHSITTVRASEFLAFYLALFFMSGVLYWWSRSLFQPQGVNLSWRGVLLEVSRWPVVLWALINVVLRIKRPYMITRKGVRIGDASASLGVYGPFIALSAISIASVWIFHLRGGAGEAQGHVGLVLLNLLVSQILLAVTVGLEVRDVGRDVGSAARGIALRLPIVAVAGVLTLAAAASFVVAWAPLLEALR